MSNEYLRGNATQISHFQSIFFHVTRVVIFEVKNWPESTFCFFVDWELVSPLLKNNATFYLVIIQSFLKFLLTPWICSAERIRGMSQNFQILNIFKLSLLKS